jgi:hypothetical protein
MHTTSIRNLKNRGERIRWNEGNMYACEKKTLVKRRSHKNRQPKGKEEK